MADHGGYRKPTKPAVVSGPGAHSQRTDGGVSHQVLSAVPDQDYGDKTAQLNSERQAPMAGATPPPPSAQPTAAGTDAGSPPGVQLPQFTGPALSAPSQRPDEPITTGSPIGAGAGPEVLSGGTAPVTPGAGTGQMSSLLQRLSATDTTGILGQLYQAALSHGA